MIKNCQVLLDLHIIEYSSKNNFNLVLRELCLYLNLNDDRRMLQTIVDQLHIIFKEKYHIFKKEVK